VIPQVCRSRPRRTVSTSGSSGTARLQAEGGGRFSQRPLRGGARGASSTACAPAHGNWAARLSPATAQDQAGHPTQKSLSRRQRVPTRAWGGDGGRGGSGPQAFSSSLSAKLLVLMPPSEPL
jgi:hypothetical protein